MLLGLLGALIFASVAFAASVVAFPKLRTDGSWAHIAARLLLGSALVVVVLHAFVHVVSLRVAAWVIVGVIVAGIVLRGAAALRWLPPSKLQTFFLVLLVALAVWRLWPVVDIGYLTAFEGTGNHDDVHYVLVAQWLLGHPAGAPIPIDPDLAYASAAQVALRELPRYGAELVLAFVSAVTGITTFEAYPVAAVVGSLLWLSAAALLLASAGYEGNRVNALALAIAAASPIAAYIGANGNLATYFGCAFLAGYAGLLARSIEPDTPITEAVAVGILLGATVVTYGEAVPLAAIVTAVVLVYAWRRRADGGAWMLFRPFAVAGFSGLLVAPYAVLDTLALLSRNVGIVANRLSAPYWNSMYEGRGPARALLTTLTLAPELLAGLSAIVVTIAALCVLAVVTSRITRGLAYSAAPLLIAGMALLAFASMTDFGYGKMKAIQLLSIPLAVVVALPVARALLEMESRSWRSIGVAACGAVTVGLLGYVSATTFASARGVAQTKHVSRDLAALSQAAQLLPRDAVIFVSSHLGPHPFMSSRYIALVMRETKLVYAPELMGGGYLHGLERDYAKRAKAITHVLTATDADFAAPAKEPATFRNASFQLVPVPAAGGIAEFAAGFHGNEGGERWMDQRARIRVFGTGARRLRIAFPYRYGGASGSEDVSVLTQTGGYTLESKGGVGFMEILIPAPDMEGEQVFSLPGGRGVIEVPLAKLAVQDVEIRSRLTATSPNERGESADGRKLSFRVGKVEVMP